MMIWLNETTVANLRARCDAEGLTIADAVHTACARWATRQDVEAALHATILELQRAVTGTESEPFGNSEALERGVDR